MISIRSFGAFSLQQAHQEILKIKEEGFQPVLGFVFSSYKIGIQGLLDSLALFPGIRIFGSSTCGEFLFDHQRSDVMEESCVVCLFEGPTDWFRLKAFSGLGKDSSMLGTEIGHFGQSAFPNAHLLVMASGMKVNGQEIVDSARAIGGPSLQMFGGLAGDDSRFEETYVFTNDEILNDGAVVMAIDAAKVEMNGLATSGWIGIGADLQITKAEGNVVYSIDNQPALDVYIEHLGVSDEDLPGIGVEFPLLVKRADQEVLRAVLGVDRIKKSLIFAGTVPEGAIVNFSSSPGFNVIEETKKEIEGFASRYGSADLLVLFSCMARHKALGVTISEELQTISDAWSAPLIGFFTYGEIGTNSGASCDFYNETCSLVRLKFLF